EMLELPIPKLCTQLLVENAVKFTTKTTPPWHISIEGRRDKNQWYVCVRDNGPGFQEDVIKTLHKQIDEINKNGLLPCLELNGMGLLNIYIRFYLIYHAVFIFELGNQKSGGAFVTIGGKTNEEALKL
ncbi:ATP-binding protein, partial [Romboutsia ilealis]|nr:ATP-binding protein [Romboutsia ilealis]